MTEIENGFLFQINLYYLCDRSLTHELSTHQGCHRVDKVRSLRYVKKSVEAAIESLESDKDKEQKLAIMMVRLIPVGTAITVARVNELMEQAYY